MKVYIRLSLMFLTSIFLLLSCGSDDGGETKPTPSTQPQVFTLELLDVSLTAGDEEIVLSWKNPEHSSFKEVVICRDTSSFPSRTNEGTKVYNGNATSYVDKGITNGTKYYYSLFPIDNSNNTHTLITVSGTPADLVAPHPVSSFTAAGNDEKVVLNWVNSTSSDFEGVKIIRKTGSKPTSLTDGTEIYSGTDTNYIDAPLTNGTNYFYSIYAHDEVPNYSTEVSANAVPADTMQPDPITNFTAVSGDEEILLSWTNPSTDDFVDVVIVRNSSANPTIHTDGVQIFTGTGTSYTDTPLTNGETYYYSVFARDEVPNYSTAVSSNAIPQDVTPPAAVTGFTATSGDEEILLSWNNPTDADFEGVVICRLTSGYPSTSSEGTLVFDGTGTTTVDDNLTNNQTYYYSIFAKDEVPNYSVKADANATPIDVTPPAPVTGFTATSGDEQITLSWTNPTDADFSGVMIRRSTISYPSLPNTGTQVYSGTGNSTVDSGLTNGQRYYYTIFARDEVPNYSTGHNASDIPADTVPPSPVTNFTATGDDSRNILRWQNPSDSDFQSVVIRRATGSYPTTPTSGTHVYTGTGSDSDLPYTTGIPLTKTYTTNEDCNPTDSSYYELNIPSAVSITVTGTYNTESCCDTFYIKDGTNSVIFSDKGSGSFTEAISGNTVRFCVDSDYSVNKDGYGITAVTYNDGYKNHIDNGLSNGVTYYYSIWARDEVPLYSVVRHSSASPVDLPPDNPSDFVARAGYDRNKITWTNPTRSDFNEVVLCRKVGSYPTSHTDGPIYTGTAESYVDGSVSRGTTYYYKIFAKDVSSQYSTGVGDTATPSDENGAFLMVNSWGTTGSWENVDNGKYWMTYGAAKKVGVYTRCWNANPNYDVKAIIRLKITHPMRSDVDIELGVGGTSLATKEFISMNHTLGDLPFPNNEIHLDITEFYPDMNNNKVWVKIKDKGDSATGTIETVGLRIWTTNNYYYQGFNHGWQISTLPETTSNNTTYTYEFTSHQSVLPNMQPSPDMIQAQTVPLITGMPSQSEIDKLKQTVGVYQPGKNYNKIINGFGTGLKPPTAAEWNRIANDPNFILGVLTSKALISTQESLDHSTSIYFPPIGNQGGEGSCVAWSSGYYIQTFYMNKNRSQNISGCGYNTSPWPGYPDAAYQDKIMSPEFLYHLINEGVDGGSFYSDASEVLVQYGICTWDKMPYDDGDHTTWPDEDDFSQAPLNRGVGDVYGRSSQEYSTNINSDARVEAVVELLENDYMFSASIDADCYSNLTSHDVWTYSNIDSGGWSTNHANTIVGFKNVFDPNNPDN